MDDLKVIYADVLDGLAQIDTESVQCVVTSPPYWGLRDYGTDGQIGLEPTFEGYVGKMVEVFHEVRRVLKTDGVLWLNLGDCYATGAGSYRNPGSDVKPIEHGGKHAFSKDSARAQPNRMPQSKLKPKDLVGIPWRVAFALQADRWYLRSDIIWSKPNPMPESVTDRPTKSHEYIFLLTKSARYFYDAKAIKGRTVDPADNRGSRQQRSEYDRNQKKPGVRRSVINPKTAKPYSHANARTVWAIPTTPYTEAHFATFPTAIPERCISAGSKPGDLILDPFAGSGTTLLVARGLGRRAIGIEINRDYQPLIEKRCSLPWERSANADEHPSLFDDEKELPG